MATVLQLEPDSTTMAVDALLIYWESHQLFKLFPILLIFKLTSLAPIITEQPGGSISCPTFYSRYCVKSHRISPSVNTRLSSAGHMTGFRRSIHIARRLIRTNCGPPLGITELKAVDRVNIIQYS